MSEPKKPTIDSLVTQAQTENSQAFGLIYDEFVTPIYRYIYYRVDPQIAEDLTEETFLKAWQSLQQYKKKQGYPFSAWLFKIAHNLVCDYYRKHRTVELVDEQTPDPIQDRNPVFQINVKFNQIRLRKAIQELPTNYQQVIVLKYINDLPNDEIAQMIGKSENTVRTLQFRALQKLRALLQNERYDF